MKDTLGDFKRLPKESTLPMMRSAPRLPQPRCRTTAVVVQLRRHAGRRLPAGRLMGGAKFQFGASVTTYHVGHLTGNSRMARVGARLLRAQIVSQTVTHSIKAVVKRTRPDGSTQNSFPSGHTSVSFASATVLQREFGWKVGLPAYAVASYIGMSRVEGKRHFASDVLFGAAIGVMAGRAATVDIAGKRFLVSPSATRGGGAVSFVWAGQQ